jgi:23S rRNA G2445 N2-methylase RlmL
VKERRSFPSGRSDLPSSRSIWRQVRPILITCPKGIAPFLRREIDARGFPILSEESASLETQGTLQDTLRLNLWLRTAHRVLFLLHRFSARSPGELYGAVWDLPWEEIVHEDGYLSVTSWVENPAIRDSRFANQKCKDAIVDRIKEKRGRRPDSGPERRGAVVHLYWKGDRCALYLDTSGEPLARRGYRKIPLRAPMQETLAAAVVLATGWKGGENFVNPMCGSGTLAIEAALLGLGRAPALTREDFGFAHAMGYDESAWRRLKAEAEREKRHRLSGRIVATDIDPKAVQAARKNAMAAGVSQWIRFEVCDFSRTPIPEGTGVVVLNPEYGARLGQAEALGGVYREIGDFLKKRCQGYRGYIFTGNPDLAKHVGLRTQRRIPFQNSNIECRLLEYALYEGSRKEKRSVLDSTPEDTGQDGYGSSNAQG